jgi:hypothetical protein
MSLAIDLINEFNRVKGDRVNWDDHWQEISDRVMPKSSDFTTKRSAGERRQQYIYDSTAVLSNERFAAAMESFIMPRHMKWHKLRPSDQSLVSNPEVRDYFDVLNDTLYSRRYEPDANFSSQANESFLNLGAFGTQCLFVDYQKGAGLKYESVHLSNVFFDVNWMNEVSVVYRLKELTAGQAIEEFGEDNVPKEWLDERSQSKKVKVVHLVKERQKYDPKGINNKSFRFASYHIAYDEKEMLRESGYRTMPYIVSRYIVNHREVYGRSPAMQVLPEIKMLNEMTKEQITGAHLKTNPPLLLHDDGILGFGNANIDLTPGALNYGGVSPDGRQLIVPMQTGSQPELLEQLMETRRQYIRDAFLVSLFQLFAVESPEYMKAGVSAQLALEKAQLLAPAAGRQQTEWAGKMIERELDLLELHGLLPEPPEALADIDYEVVYDAPINRMQENDIIVGLNQTLITVSPFVEANPDLMMKFNGEQILEEVSYINGLPQRMLRTEEQLEEIKQRRAEAQANEAQAAQLEQGASAAKDMADAQATLRGF